MQESSVLYLYLSLLTSRLISLTLHPPTGPACVIPVFPLWRSYIYFKFILQPGSGQFSPSATKAFWLPWKLLQQEGHGPGNILYAVPLCRSLHLQSSSCCWDAHCLQKAYSWVCDGGVSFDEGFAGMFSGVFILKWNGKWEDNEEVVSNSSRKYVS